MKALVYLPTLLVNLMRAWLLPRWLFVATYAPQGDDVRQAEMQIKNAVHRAEYYTRRMMYGGEK